MRKLKGNLMLLITAIIWGVAFVAQSAGMEYVGPFTYNGIRTFLGGLVLLPLVFIFGKLNYLDDEASKKERKETTKHSIKAGMVCGLLLFAASSLQQCGLLYTTAGKAGFLTALYVVFVPILGIIVGKKIPKIIWLCVVMAIAGFYLLCINEGFSISTGDLMELACAVFFSIHILVIDHFTNRQLDGVVMSCTQFLVAGGICIICMFIFEEPCMADILAAKWTILYAGVLSCGVAYTLQILGQQYTDPTSATLLMSLESVFAAVGGWIILGEVLSPRELAGCALVFAAVLLAQIPLPGSREKI